MSQPEVTFVLTSCGRVDLLQQTITSFEKYNTYPIKRAIITEDSCDDNVYQQVEELFGDRFEIWANKEKKGQIKSIVDAYATIDTPYIFHCEDDWEFTRSGFIEESLKILETEPKILQPFLESIADANIATESVELFKEEKKIDINGASYLTFSIAEGWEWGFFSFKPGLRRKSDYDLIKGYARFTNELDIGCCYKEQDFYCVVLDPPAMINTGHERHVADPTRIWPKRRKAGKEKGLKRLQKHLRRLVTEGKW
ncbi:glycosyltransferase [Terasakiella sp. SH-1]|uniref:glycosyltransferase n=1 Tax=Terasakiella sp. SH-1 TaxID=2560057 RepID=UPI0010739CFD|nr:glycosyltransferase [Terasakiella sp. SH-1]